jgi:AcrR family transcriptional regulator
MGSKDRRQREKSETRTRILDAARHLFASEGYEAVSMRRIADAIEYSPTAIYAYFADKDTLVRELCREDFGSLAGVFRELAAITDPVERIAEIGRAYVAFGAKYPNHYRLMFMTPKPFHDLAEEDLATRGQPDEDAYAFLRAAVAQAIDHGRLRPEIKKDADLVAQTCWAGVHGVVGIELTHCKDRWIDLRPLKDRTTAMVLNCTRGLFTQKPAPRPAKPIKRKAGAK